MRGEFLYYNLKKFENFNRMMSKYRHRLCQNLKFRFFKIWIPQKYEIGTSQLRKNTKSAPQNLKLDCDLEFSIQKSIFQNPKLISPIPLESCCETQKFEISDVENPQILIFASK